MNTFTSQCLQILNIIEPLSSIADVKVLVMLIIECTDWLWRWRRRWYKYLMLATATKKIRLERCGREETQSDTCQESSVRAVGSAGAPQQSRWSSLLSPASWSCSRPHPSSSLAVSSNIPAIPLSSDISASFPPGFHFLSLTRRGPLVWPILVQFVFNILGSWSSACAFCPWTSTPCQSDGPL